MWKCMKTVGETGHRSLHDEATEAADIRREEVKASIAAQQSIATARETFAPQQIRIILDEQDLYTWDQA